MRNPGIRNLDLLIEKGIALPGRFALQIRTEFFNALNTVRYAGPGTILTAADFGLIFLRQINTPRQIQFGARLSFLTA